jgi:predicted transcriptional regulator
MPNTSVHLPQALLASLDRIAAERGTSRNRLIVESCRRAVEELSRWPPDLFSNHHLSDAELQDLQQGEQAFRKDVENARRTRARPPF